MQLIESVEDFEIIRLKQKVKLGGNTYEDSYSFWVHHIPSNLKDEYDKIKTKTIEELTKEEQELLLEYQQILKFSLLQTKIDENNYTKKEYIEYLRIRSIWPLEKLRLSRLSEMELEEVNRLINTPDILKILEKKDLLTTSERYVKEILSSREFIKNMIDINSQIQCRMGEIRAKKSASLEISKKTRFK